MKQYCKAFFKRNSFSIALTAFLIAMIICIPQQIKVSLIAQDTVSPRFFPYLSSIAALVCCVLSMVLDAFSLARELKNGSTANSGVDSNVKGNILNEKGEVYQKAFEAKKRGVLFDSARGSRNWSAEVARTAFAQGFTPDVITDDLTCLSNDPQTSRLHVHMGECMAMGLTLDEVLYRATNVPATFMKGVQVGIKRGMPANITILDVQEGPHMYTDAFGVNYEGNVFMKPMTTIVNGEIKYNAIVTDY